MTCCQSRNKLTLGQRGLDFERFMSISRPSQGQLLFLGRRDRKKLSQDKKVWEEGTGWVRRMLLGRGREGWRGRLGPNLNKPFMTLLVLHFVANGGLLESNWL